MNRSRPDGEAATLVADGDAVDSDAFGADTSGLDTPQAVNSNTVGAINHAAKCHHLGH
jgi:hypothetical protein